MRVGDFLPQGLRVSETETNVLLSVHSPECPACREYVAELNTIGNEFRVWDARLSVVVDEPAVVIADRYGQVFYNFVAGAGHNFPRTEVVAEALKFIGTLCPE